RMQALVAGLIGLWLPISMLIGYSQASKIANDVNNAVPTPTVPGSGNATPVFGPSSSGGGISNNGTLTLTNSTISGNNASGSGGNTTSYTFDAPDSFMYIEAFITPARPLPVGKAELLRVHL